MKKLLSLLVVSLLVLSVFAACGDGSSGGNGAAAPADGGQTDSPDPQDGADAPVEADKTIILIAKSYQNPYYQVLFEGARDAGAVYGFEVVTNGPDSESNIPMQVDQVNAAINQNPTAIGLAACDPDALQETLAKARDNGIPVIGFDSGVPGDASGAVVATATTDNENAGGVVAQELFADEAFLQRISQGTEENPTVVAVLAQDATSGSIVLRVNGFVDTMVGLLESIDGMEGAVEVTGQTLWNRESANPAKIRIAITVPPSTIQSDIQTAASAMLQTPNLVAVFPANLGTVDAFLSATADGTDLDRESGRYADLIVVGFDAGRGQKTAIENGYFLGSGTQDPYTMGYETVRMAAEIYEGATPQDVDTGTVWYTAQNMNDDGVAELLYD